MSDLPYTVTDVNGTRLTVVNGLLGLVVEGEGTIYLHLPIGSDVALLARAVLAAAGDTGHMVVSEEEMTAGRLAAIRIAAEATRDRAVRALDEAPEGSSIVNVLRALPLLPDGDDTESTAPAVCAVACPHGHDHTCARSPKHYGPHRDVKQKGDEGCSWTDHEDIHAQMEGEARAYRGGRIDGARDAEDGLARRVAALESLVADQSTVIERQSRDIEDLRAAMGNAQIAIRGLGSRFTAEEDG